MKLVELKEAAIRLEVQMNKNNRQLAQSGLDKIKSKITFNKQ